MSPIFIGNRRIYGPESSDPGGLGASDEGSIVYNTTDDVLKAWDGSAWSALGGGGGGGSQTYATLVQGAYASSNISGLSWSGNTSNDTGGVSSIPIPTNRKTYIEILWSSNGGGNPGPGVCAGQNTELGLAGPKGWYRISNSSSAAMETSTYTFNDVSGGNSLGGSTGEYFGIAMDNTANSGGGSITFYRNGNAMFSGGNGWTGRTDLYFHWQNNGTGTSSGTFNFGATAFQYPLSGFGGLYS